MFVTAMWDPLTSGSSGSVSLTCGPSQRSTLTDQRSTRPGPNWAGWAWIRAWIRAGLGPTRVNLWLRHVGCWIPIGFCPRARHSRMVHGGLSTVGLWTTAWFIVDQVHLLPVSHGSWWKVRTARLLLLLTPFSSISPTAVLSPAVSSHAARSDGSVGLRG